MPDEQGSQADPTPDRAGLIRRVVSSLVVVVVAVSGLYVLGATHPPTRSAITSDRLGPDSGESVATYLGDAAVGLAGVRAGQRWALISLRAPVDDDTAWSLMADTLQSQIGVHVPIPGVATPAKFVAVTGDRGSMITARTNAIAAIAADAPVGATGGDEAADRALRVSTVTIGRLRSGCACIVALVVRTTGDRARQIAADAQVRSVEVLPADAAGGRFAVTALLPEQTDRVVPLDDSGPVPAR